RLSEFDPAASSADKLTWCLRVAQALAQTHKFPNGATRTQEFVQQFKEIAWQHGEETWKAKSFGYISVVPEMNTDNFDASVDAFFAAAGDPGDAAASPVAGPSVVAPMEDALLLPPVETLPEIVSEGGDEGNEGNEGEDELSEAVEPSPPPRPISKGKGKAKARPLPPSRESSPPPLVVSKGKGKAKGADSVFESVRLMTADDWRYVQTKQAEELLDEISKGLSGWHETNGKLHKAVCDNCRTDDKSRVCEAKITTNKPRISVSCDRCLADNKACKWQGQNTTNTSGRNADVKKKAIAMVRFLPEIERRRALCEEERRCAKEKEGAAPPPAKKVKAMMSVVIKGKRRGVDQGKGKGRAEPDRLARAPLRKAPVDKTAVVVEPDIQMVEIVEDSGPLSQTQATIPGEREPLFLSEPRSTPPDLVLEHRAASPDDIEIVADVAGPSTLEREVSPGPVRLTSEELIPREPVAAAAAPVAIAAAPVANVAPQVPQFNDNDVVPDDQVRAIAAHARVMRWYVQNGVPRGRMPPGPHPDEFSIRCAHEMMEEQWNVIQGVPEDDGIPPALMQTVREQRHEIHVAMARAFASTLTLEAAWLSQLCILNYPAWYYQAGDWRSKMPEGFDEDGNRIDGQGE
ncbi:hypothetical protein FA95DRAFT_1614081, partial [Auriscalpium vulgare]